MEEILESLRTFVCILIDARNRQIRKVTINDGWRGMSDCDPADGDNTSMDFVLRISGTDDFCENLDCFDQKFGAKGPKYNYGFICWFRGRKYIVVGGGMIYRYYFAREVHVDEPVFSDCEFPIENIVEGSGPIRGKLVIQWI